MVNIMIDHPTRVRLATRIFIAALHRYYTDASMINNWGKGVIGILKKQFPGQNVTATPSEIGKRLYSIAMRELQRNPNDAEDLVQEFFTYITTGTDRPTSGEESEKNQPWNFADDFETWQEALKNMYTNLRHRAISRSRTRYHKEMVQAIDPKTNEPKVDAEGKPVMVEAQKMRQRSIDDAFGKRSDEGSGPRAQGEGRIPTPDASPIGQALDEKTAIKEFLDVIDEFVPDLKQGLDFSERVLFDVIFEDGIGSFSSDIKENMGQSTALKEKLQQIAEDPNNKSSVTAQAVLDRYGKRWSGFVSDARKKLLDKIQNYVEYNLSKREFNTLWDMFYEGSKPKHVTGSLQSMLAIAYRVAFS